jgi:integrase
MVPANASYDDALNPRVRRDPSHRPHREIDILAADDVLALMAACSRRAPTGIRNRALIALLYGSGLRISEALSLRPKDVDLDGLALTVQNGKGDKRRVAGLLPDAVDAVQRWADRRAEFGATARDPFFCTTAHGASGPHPTNPGGRLSREYVARTVKRLARKAGIDRRVHCHGFRHSHADLLRRRGFDVEEIRVQLGHASLDVTSTYLDHIGAHELPAKMRSITGVLEDARRPRAELGELLQRLGDGDVRQLLAILKRGAVLA